MVVKPPLTGTTGYLAVENGLQLVNNKPSVQLGLGFFWEPRDLQSPLADTPLQDGAPKIAKLVNISGLNMVYGRYSYS